MLLPPARPGGKPAFFPQIIVQIFDFQRGRRGRLQASRSEKSQESGYTFIELMDYFGVGAAATSVRFVFYVFPGLLFKTLRPFLLILVLPQLLVSAISRSSIQIPANAFN